MEVIENEKLKNIDGGGVSAWTVLGIGAGIGALVGGTISLVKAHKYNRMVKSEGQKVTAELVEPSKTL